MSQVEKQRTRLISLLKELFQLDQPDLDFGFYRIMHAKAGQVSKFLEEDLLGIIREAFGEADDARIAEAKAAYDAARKQAVDYGAPDPDATEPVKKAKAAWDAAKDSGSNEGDVYDHLYRFFERYYDSGDFMSRRYFARETDGKAAPYAVPYDGREVYLHWANRDQYYIKTSEYLTNFTFDPTQAKEFKEHHGELFGEKPLKVHCRVVSASEGEHNNVKASEQTERYFIIHGDEPVKVEIGETGAPELVIQFEYRADPEKTGQDGTWRKKRLAEAVEAVEAALPQTDQAEDYVKALLTPAPTEAEKDRTLLAKYLAQYTGRNTMDYFIHKDLGGFLKRELDFYIKNEVMRLDDIEAAEAPRVETYLAKIKVLRRSAQYLIDFLAQLEDFQKKLWLKRKFVVDTQYCITLDRIPDKFYPDIASSEGQREEWVRLLAIDSIDGYSVPLTVEFLKENQHLPLDTAFVEEWLKDSIVAEFTDLENDQVGVIINANNANALSLASARYVGSVKTVYIDPPYNTESNSILYKNSYKHSSWLSLIMPLLVQSRKFELPDVGVHAVSIDKAEVANLITLFSDVFADRDTVPVSVIHNPGGTMGKNFSGSGEFCVFSYDDDRKCIALEDRADSPDVRDFMNTAKGSAGNHLRSTGKTCFYPVYVKNGRVVGVGAVEPDDFHPNRNEKLSDGRVAVYPIDNDGDERKWVLGRDTVENHLDELTVKTDTKTGEFRIVRTKNRINFKTVWTQKTYSAKKYGTELLGHMVPETRAMPPLYPKSLHLVRDIVFAALGDTESGTVVDYFAGSGTTGHSIFQLQRDIGAKHKFLLVEMGAHFDSVLRPRLVKAAYASDWKDGKPLTSDSLSHAFKYIRLETYEDALNNLAFRDQLVASGDPAFNLEYMLRYWLDFETKGSPSLLSIEQFSDPTAYKLKIKKAGTDEYVEKPVDLIETFNWLIGLHVEHIDQWRSYDAAFKREEDAELPGDTSTRLMIDGSLKETEDGAWRFRKIEGYTLRTPGDQSDRERALVVWRKLTGDLEQDNLMLDEWFRKYRLSAQDTEFDVIYVNESNNLPNLRQEEETWKVRLIEEAFHQAMWDVED